MFKAPNKVTFFIMVLGQLLLIESGRLIFIQIVQTKIISSIYIYLDIMMQHISAVEYKFLPLESSK